MPNTNDAKDAVESQIDVILVSFNSAHRLQSCVLALSDFLATTTWSVQFVDNASSDGSAELAAALAPTATLLVNSSNRGFASAVNQGVRAGSAPILLLANPDVSEIRGDISEVLRIFCNDSSVAAVAVRMVDHRGRLQRTCHTLPTVGSMLAESVSLSERLPWLRFAKQYRMLDWDMTSPREVEDACGGFLFLRRSALGEVGPFDEGFFLYSEETDWLARATSRGWRVVFTPTVEVVHHGGGSSNSATAELLNQHLMHSGYRFLRKHRGRMAEILARALFICLDAIRWLWHARRWGNSRCGERRSLARARLSVHLGKTPSTPGRR